MSDAERTDTSTRCNNCDTEVPNGAKFCQACGSPVYKTNDTHQQSSSTEPGSRAQATHDFQGSRSFTFLEAVGRGFSKYAVFSGRASRPEYWYWYLFNILLSIATGLLAVQLASSDAELDAIAEGVDGFLMLVLFLPSLAVGARRLHDTNRSGWWLLLVFTLIGIVPLIVFMCLPGDPDDNRYGFPVVLPSNGMIKSG